MNRKNTALVRPALGLVFGLLLQSGVLRAQANWQLVVAPKAVARQLTLRTNQTDSLRVLQAAGEAVRQLHGRGYLAARPDSLVWRQQTATLYLNPGPLYRWVDLAPGNVPAPLLAAGRYHEKTYRNAQFRYGQLVRLEEELLRFATDHGFPFAALRLDSVTIVENGIRAQLHYEPGPPVVFDTVLVVGNARLKPRFLTNLLRIRTEEPYSESRFRQIDGLLRSLP